MGHDVSGFLEERCAERALEFDARNADVGELAVLEPVDSVSEYRLE